ncbi:MAG: OsmC family protein [Elusimicrobiota bacterium]
MTKIEVKFPGNKKVNAIVNGFEIKTDQPIASGGDGTAPSPFEVFLASIATCAGIYAISFFKTRNLNTDGFGLSMEVFWDKEKHKLGKVIFNITVPSDFPEKYIPALKQTIDMCTVKRTIFDPPEFETVIK